MVVKALALAALLLAAPAFAQEAPAPQHTHSPADMSAKLRETAYASTVIGLGKGLRTLTDPAQRKDVKRREALAYESLLRLRAEQGGHYYLAPYNDRAHRWVQRQP